MNININDQVIVKDNLKEEMEKLSFDSLTIESFCEEFVGTKQNVYNIWTDEDTKCVFATVDLCCEIPVQCLEKI